MWDYLKSIDEKAYEKHRQWMQLALNLWMNTLAITLRVLKN